MFNINTAVKAINTLAKAENSPHEYKATGNLMIVADNIAVELVSTDYAANYATDWVLFNDENEVIKYLGDF